MLKHQRRIAFGSDTGAPSCEKETKSTGQGANLSTLHTPSSSDSDLPKTKEKGPLAENIGKLGGLDTHTWDPIPMYICFGKMA